MMPPIRHTTTRCALNKPVTACPRWAADGIVYLLAISLYWLPPAYSTANAAPPTTPPKQFVIHNKTQNRINLKLFGKVYGHVSLPFQDKKTNWDAVRFLCSNEPYCQADIVVNPKTPDEKALGTGTLELRTGYITPSHLSAHGYQVTVNGPGEITVEYVAP